MTTGRHADPAPPVPSTSKHVARLLGLIAGCVAIVALGFTVAIFLTHLYINAVTR